MGTQYDPVRALSRPPRAPGVSLARTPRPFTFAVRVSVSKLPRRAPSTAPPQTAVHIQADPVRVLGLLDSALAAAPARSSLP